MVVIISPFFVLYFQRDFSRAHSRLYYYMRGDSGPLTLRIPVPINGYKNLIRPAREQNHCSRIGVDFSDYATLSFQMKLGSTVLGNRFYIFHIPIASLN